MTPLIRNILWPTDFSPLSLAAADAALHLARRVGARLHVVHVAPIMVPDSTIALETGGDLLAYQVDTRTPATKELNRLVDSYLNNDPSIIRGVRVGVPWFEICEYARSASIDIIVIATHGRTGLKHVMLGSVAERVVQHAACPVLVVKSFELASIA